MEKVLNEKKASKNEVKEEKYSYEQLKNICDHLYKDKIELIKRLQQVEQYSMFKRMEFLLKIIEMSEKFNDADFITTCIDEVKEIMTVPEQGDAADDKKENVENS